MELVTISDISRRLNISTRTLRYYEEIGLIQSVKKEDYAYRTYDETALTKLRQILVLRKLRISLKQIGLILQSEDTAEIIETFERNLSEVDDEITALSTIRDIINTFIERLTAGIHLSVGENLLDDTALLEAVDALTVSKSAIKEKTTADLEQASTKLNTLTDRDVRIVYLPPATVAAYQYEGDDPEMHVHQVIDPFVIGNKLTEIKPDIRHYGFNSPNPTDETGYHGYEIWVTIPNDFHVPEPIVKKSFRGGLYAAHMIPFGAFEEWGLLDNWMHNNEKYEYDGSSDSRNMYGFLEEHINYVNRVHLLDPEAGGMQLDLLVPVKMKEVQ